VESNTNDSLLVRLRAAIGELGMQAIGVPIPLAPFSMQVRFGDPRYSDWRIEQWSITETPQEMWTPSNPTLGSAGRTRVVPFDYFVYFVCCV
jgi:hypothetical protein